MAEPSSSTPQIKTKFQKDEAVSASPKSTHPPDVVAKLNGGTESEEESSNCAVSPQEPKTLQDSFSAAASPSSKAETTKNVSTNENVANPDTTPDNSDNGNSSENGNHIKACTDEAKEASSNTDDPSNSALLDASQVKTNCPTKTTATADDEGKSDDAQPTIDDKSKEEADDDHKEEEDIPEQEKDCDQGKESGEGAEDEEAEEEWELVQVMSIEELQSSSPQKCMTDKCTTVAAVAYKSSLAPDEKWYSCLDCQEADFGGWPDPEEVRPVLPFLTPEHLELFLNVCSLCNSSSNNNGKKKKKKKQVVVPSMPDYLPDTDPRKIETSQHTDENREETPLKLTSPPGAANSENSGNDGGVALKNADIVDSGAAETNKVVTPIPPVSRNIIVAPARTAPHGAKKVPATTRAGGDGTSSSTVTPIPASSSSRSAGPNRAALFEMHRQWQKQAEGLGGQRIVVSKPEAKTLIFDFLYDSFAPQNITQIYKGLKGVVPSPVLKACLGDMSPDPMANAPTFADSDDEEEDDKAKKKNSSENKENSDPDSKTQADCYASSLCLKPGKTASTTLYYVAYSKLENNGDGLDRDARNDLMAAMSQAQAQKEALEGAIRSTKQQAAQLRSEPTNEEATKQLEVEQSHLSALREETEEARAYKVNEKHKVQLKRRIDRMAAEWRKRRRLCKDFLLSMEEMSEGTITAKKCFSGNGPIELDSDEAVQKAALNYYANSLKKGPKRKRKEEHKSSKRLGSASALPPSPNFVAVLLNSQGCVQRVYAESDGSVAATS